MFLNFIGSGSAFNTLLGNNSAFLKKGHALLLMDCGGTTFDRLQEAKLLEGVKELYVVITHRHPDHVASLGDLIFYAYYILNIKVVLLTPEQEAVAILLKYMGVEKDLYTHINLRGKYALCTEALRVEIEPVPVEHVPNIPSYGYLIQYENSQIFYSGDSKMIPEKILQSFEKGDLDFIYQDVCAYQDHHGPHLHIDHLTELIAPQARHRVFCMHRDETFGAEKALSRGFNVAQNILPKKF